MDDDPRAPAADSGEPSGTDPSSATPTPSEDGSYLGGLLSVEIDFDRFCQFVAAYGDRLASTVGMVWDPERAGDVRQGARECFLFGIEYPDGSHDGDFLAVVVAPDAVTSPMLYASQFAEEEGAVIPGRDVVFYVDLPRQPHIVFAFGDYVFDVFAEVDPWVLEAKDLEPTVDTLVLGLLGLIPPGDDSAGVVEP